MRTPPPSPLRLHEPLHLSVLFDEEPLWESCADALAQEAQQRDWSTRLWFAATTAERQAELRRVQERTIGLLVVASTDAGLKENLEVLHASGQAIARLGWIDASHESVFPRLILRREAGAQAVAQEAMDVLSQRGMEHPLLIYFGRPGDTQRRRLARRRFLEAVESQGGKEGFLPTDADRRGAKKKLKEWLRSPTTDPPPESASSEPPPPSFREVHGLYAEDEELTLALLDAMMETGLRPPLLMGTGATPELAEALANGRLDALVAYLPDRLAAHVADWAEALMAGEQEVSDRELAPLLLTSEDVDLFHDEQ